MSDYINLMTKAILFKMFQRITYLIFTRQKKNKKNKIEKYMLNFSETGIESRLQRIQQNIKIVTSFLT